MSGSDQSTHPVSARAIIARVAAQHGLTAEAILAQDRRGPIVRARHQAMAEARAETGYAWKRLARIFRRDHAAVIHGARRHGEMQNAG